MGDRAAGDTATDEATEDDAFRRLQMRYGEMKKRNLVLQARVDELEAATAAAASEKRELASALTKAENRADDAASHNKVVFFGRSVTGSAGLVAGSVGLVTGSVTESGLQVFVEQADGAASHRLVRRPVGGWVDSSVTESGLQVPSWRTCVCDCGVDHRLICRWSRAHTEGVMAGVVLAVPPHHHHHIHPLACRLPSSLRRGPHTHTHTHRPCSSNPNGSTTRDGNCTSAFRCETPSRSQAAVSRGWLTD